MDPRDFNQVAIDIVVGRPPTGPAAYRSAISRAYYAAMNAAASILTGIGHSPGKQESRHKRLVIYLQQSGDAQLMRAGGMIDILRKKRNEADYDMANAIVEKPLTARSAAETAREVMEYLDEFAADSARKAAVADAIAKYKLKTNTP
jgi:uncharacterized protein (UPF0332 family)